MDRRAWRRTWIAVLGAGLIALLSTGLTPSDAAAQTCIYVVQGLPGKTVSVEVDGKSVVDGLAGGKIAGPFAVKHGTRTVAFTEGGKTLVRSKMKLAAGSNSDVVIHLPASPTGDPVVTRFNNNLDAVQNGDAAHGVAHVAAAGPIDIRVNGNVVSANVAIGEYTYKVVPARTSTVDIVSTGRTKPILGPIKVQLDAAKMNWVFVIGTPGKDLALIQQDISLSDKKLNRPSSVDTGTGGQAAKLASRGSR